MPKNLSVKIGVCLMLAGLLAALFVIAPPLDRADAQLATNSSVIIVLDVSGSMNELSGTEPGLSRLDVAKDAIGDAVASVAPGSINLGLRTFSRCRSNLVVPVGPADPANFQNAIDGVRASGATGIEIALRAAVADLPAEGERTIILVSDGEETCGGNPCAAAAELLENNIAFVVNTVGLQTAGSQAEIDLGCIATATGGTLSSANDVGELFKAVKDSIEKDPECTVDLILCYAPEVRFHPNERYFPMDVESFVRDSELDWVRSAEYFALCAGDDAIVEEPIAEFLGLGRYEAHEKRPDPRWNNWFACSNVGRGFRSNEFTRPYSGTASNGAGRAIRQNGTELDEGEGFVLAWQNYGRINLPGEEPDGLNNLPVGGRVTAPMYAQLGQANGERFIVYHMFYGFDPKSAIDTSDFNVAQLGDQLLAHEGDWERLIVVLGPDDIPTEVRFLGHGCAVDDADFSRTNIVPWTSRSGPGDGAEGTLQLVDGTHPVLYVAEGSHASYPYIRSTGPRACTNNGQPSGNADQTSFTDSSAVWRAWENGGVLNPQDKCWYGFGGAWGVGGDLDVAAGIGGGIAGGVIAGPGGAVIGGVGGALGGGDLRSHDTGPAGPHWNVRGLPAGTNCQARSILVSAPLDLEWDATPAINGTGFNPGEQVVISMASVETPVGTATVGGDGSLNATFTVPQGFGAGGHRVIVRSVATGEILAVVHRNVVPPADCIQVEFNLTADVDGDSVKNECDPISNDGPVGDFDGDGVLNAADNCNRVANADQASLGRATIGRACAQATGFNAATGLVAQFNQEPVSVVVPEEEPPAEILTPPATPTPSTTLDYEPLTSLPPEGTGAFGFGSVPNIQPTVPLQAVNVPLAAGTEAGDGEAADAANPDAPLDAAAIDEAVANGSVIAYTGSNSEPLAALGAWLVGFGALGIGASRIRRRNSE